VGHSFLAPDPEEVRKATGGPVRTADAVCNRIIQNSATSQMLYLLTNQTPKLVGVKSKVNSK
jgi:hypothetical protein